MEKKNIICHTEDHHKKSRDTHKGQDRAIVKLTKTGNWSNNQNYTIFFYSSVEYKKKDKNKREKNAKLHKEGKLQNQVPLLNVSRDEISEYEDSRYIGPSGNFFQIKRNKNFFSQRPFGAFSSIQNYKNIFCTFPFFQFQTIWIKNQVFQIAVSLKSSQNVI